MKNNSNYPKEYLNNTSSTNLAFGDKTTIWTFTFEGVVALIKSKENRFLGYKDEITHSYKAYDYNYEPDLSSYPHAITVYKLVEGEMLPSSAVSFSNTTPSIDLATTTTFTQKVTTAANYTGTVTYEITENTAGASINATTGAVTVTHEGSVTVKATAAAVENKFQESSASYTLTVTVRHSLPPC